MTKAFRAGVVFIFYVITVCGLEINKNAIKLSIGVDGVKKLVSITGNSSFTIQVINIPSSVSALIFEVHAQIENLVLSEKPKATIGKSITGRNIGMVYKLQTSESEAHMWLFHEGQKDISALLQITPLNAYGPVPGGCNMEFPTEIAPYLKLRIDSENIYVEYQHANLGSPRNQPAPLCYLSLPYIIYEVYVSFLKENEFGEDEYFDKIVQMSNMSYIRLNSNKIKSYSVHPNTRYIFRKYPNVGAVYNVVAKYTVNGVIKEAAYVPVATYGCDFSEFTVYGCRISYTVSSKLFLLLFSIYGFIVAFFGYSFLGATMFFFGFSSSFFIGFILLQKFSQSSVLNSVEFTVLVGLVGGAIWLFLWLRFYDTLIPFLLLGFVLGFLTTASVFYSPVGNFEIFMNDKNYWSLLSTGTLFVTVIFLAYPTLLTIFASAVVGSYIMLLFYDDFIGTRLSYIILNVAKRAVSKDFGFASNDYPFQAKDVIITTAWVVLSLLAVIFQWRRQSSSPLVVTSDHGICCSRSYYSSRQSSRLSFPNSEPQNDRQPLLLDNGVNYQTFPR